MVFFHQGRSSADAADAASVVSVASVVLSPEPEAQPASASPLAAKADRKVLRVTFVRVSIMMHAPFASRHGHYHAQSISSSIFANTVFDVRTFLSRNEPNPAFACSAWSLRDALMCPLSVFSFVFHIVIRFGGRNVSNCFQKSCGAPVRSRYAAPGRCAAPSSPTPAQAHAARPVRTLLAACTVRCDHSRRSGRGPSRVRRARSDSPRRI